jgi:hypothetical protein
VGAGVCGGAGEIALSYQLLVISRRRDFSEGSE